MFRVFIIVASVWLSPLHFEVYAKASKKKVYRAKAKKNSEELAFDLIGRGYRKGDIGEREAWDRLNRIDARKLNSTKRLELKQRKAFFLEKAGYDTAAASLAQQVLTKTSSPTSDRFKRAWIILGNASRKKSLQSIIEEAAGTAKLSSKKSVPVFGRNWNYYRGNYFQTKGRYKEAISAYLKVDIGDRHYLATKYQMAMTHIAMKQTDKAERDLRIVLSSNAQSMSKIQRRNRQDIVDYAKLALARIYYQDKKFKNAIKFYRAVDREGELFYDALFEQSWAFFMAGYPNHALGALHGVESPFFKNVYNPESPVLAAIVQYWMCRYDDSRSALARFSEKYGESVEGLSQFIGRKRLRSEVAYQLFEDYVSGVSSKGLGVRREVLDSAASEDAMLYLRDQYATLVSEIDQLQGKGVFGSRSSSKEALSLLRTNAKRLRKAIGDQFTTELRSLNEQYEQLYEQSQFLYVELLMSEKEKLLGRELHAASKIDRVTRRKNIAGWSIQTNQSWGKNKYDEYWWDEVGFYIFDYVPQCRDRRNNG